MKRIPIDVDELKKVFRIRNGNLERLINRFEGSEWVVTDNKKNTSQGYCRKKFNGRMIPYHVIIWILSTGEDIPQGYELDHINGNKIDNRIENLRVVTHRENQQNRKEHRKGKMVGWTYNNNTNKYIANIGINGKRYNLGALDTEEEANIIYLIACNNIEHFIDIESFKNLIYKEANMEIIKPKGYYLRNNKYVSQIGINRKLIELGRFDNKEDASFCYLIAKKLKKKYKDNKSFRELIKKEMEGSRVGNNEIDG